MIVKRLAFILDVFQVAACLFFKKRVWTKVLKSRSRNLEVQNGRNFHNHKSLICGNRLITSLLENQDLMGRYSFSGRGTCYRLPAGYVSPACGYENVASGNENIPFLTGKRQLEMHPIFRT
jgi:hypothetical protein